ncbi:MAG: guanitoxin biosynthesis heme-dependent pre-guanitoxin N-hydroxylase GntA [Gemmatimonadaceae bacterium]
MTPRVSLSEADRAFHEFVADPGFSCLAGKGVARTGELQLHMYGELGSRRSAQALARDLGAFAAEVSDDAPLRAMVAVFPATRPLDEVSFEALLWRQLQLVHDLDARGMPWDPKVADDPDDPRFAFSHGGRALFVVGMHPASSRLSRRFRWPALVFNPHAQFDMLRETGRFERLREKVREREVALQGTLNPNLADFGEQSEARQYSGKAAEPGWGCPFHRNAP